MSLNLTVATAPVGLDAAAAAATPSSFHGTTKPYTIWQAVEEATRRRTSSTASLSPPIDLVAVVLNAQQHNADASSSKTPTCRIWIRDASMPININSTCSAISCQVLIFGRSKVREIVHHLHVKRGDVMRFNRVHLQSEDPHRLSSPNGVTLYTFKHSYQDPEAGLEYMRLLHVDPDDSDAEIQILLEQQRCNSIPNSMRTDPDYLKTLIHWYRTSYLGNLPTSNTGRALPPLPTQYRSLAELQFCQGVVSHVLAFVLHVEKVQQLPRNVKRQRLSSHSAARTTFPSATTYAALIEAKVGEPRMPAASSDSQVSNNIMTLVINQSDCLQHESFRQSLIEACVLKRPVRLSHLVSKKSGQNHSSSWSVVARARNQQDNGMILQPTDLTKITVMRETNQNEIQSLIAGARDNPVTIATQALYECLSQSQREQRNDGVLEIMSPVLNIHNAHGVSLQALLADREVLKNDPLQLCNFVQCGTAKGLSPLSSPSWAAKVLLQPLDRDNDNDNIKTGNGSLLRLQARMDGPMLHSLCGLDPQELHLSPDQARLAVDFVASLVLEQIPLRWTLAVASTTKTGDGDDSPNLEPTQHYGSSDPPVVYSVVRVSLPRL